MYAYEHHSQSPVNMCSNIMYIYPTTCAPHLCALFYSSDAAYSEAPQALQASECSELLAKSAQDGIKLRPRSTLTKQRSGSGSDLHIMLRDAP
jgi:hypothetical protein